MTVIKMTLTDLFYPKKVIPCLTSFKKYDSSLHGVAHWTRVTRFGLLLADALSLSKQEKVVIALFGWTHDLARVDDDGGNLHAIEGAEYFKVIAKKIFPDLASDILDIVQLAIRHHSDGLNAEEALYEYELNTRTTWSRDALLNTLGCCWDADRLDLLRLNIMPNESKMSTPYWQDVLPLAAKLNKRMSLLEDNRTSQTDWSSWFKE